MKPVYLHYSGSDASTWAGFARKKLKQLTQRLEYSGVPTGRQELKFGSVDIGLLVTPAFNRIRIATGGATFFVLYRLLETPSLNVQESIAAYDDNGNRQWIIHFESHTLESMTRTLLGCSEDGTKVIFLEHHQDTFVRFRTISGGTADDGYSFDLTNIGGRFISVTDSKVSLSGSRAVVSGGRIGSSEYVAFYFDASMTTPVQALRVDSPTGGIPSLAGSSDLTYAYFCFGNTYDSTPRLSHSIPYTKAVRSEETLLITDEVFTTEAAATSYLVVSGDIVSSPAGDAAISLVTISPGTASFGDPVTMSAVLHFDTGEAATLVEDAVQFGNTSNTLSGAVGLIRIIGLQDEFAAFTFYIEPNTGVPEPFGGPALGPLSGTYIAEALSFVASDEAYVALSTGTETAVVQTTTNYVVRDALGDYDLPEDTHSADIGNFSDHAIVGPADTIYSVIEPGVQGGFASYRRWVATRNADGEITEFTGPTEIGDLPVSLDRTLDEDPPRDITLSRTTVVSVYPQRVL